MQQECEITLPLAGRKLLDSINVESHSVEVESHSVELASIPRGIRNVEKSYRAQGSLQATKGALCLAESFGSLSVQPNVSPAMVDLPSGRCSGRQ